MAGTLTAASDTPCHGATDSSGNPSLEFVVDALFGNARATLAAANLGAFPAELAALLGEVRLDSQMTIAPAGDASSYWVEHGLVAVTFPNAIVPTIPPKTASFQVADLGLAVPTASGMLATFKTGQFFVPNHGFTLRLGTDARYGFEASSLRARSVANSNALVDRIFSLAQLGDQPTTGTGCAAMDAVACDLVGQPRGCLADACGAGLLALASNLAAVFDSLDGDGLDFWLAGSAPVIDLDADGRADALGTTTGVAGVAAGPGLWSAEIQARAGSYVAYGAWTGQR